MTRSALPEILNGNISRKACRGCEARSHWFKAPVEALSRLEFIGMPGDLPDKKQQMYRKRESDECGCEDETAAEPQGRRMLKGRDDRGINFAAKCAGVVEQF